MKLSPPRARGRGGVVRSGCAWLALLALLILLIPVGATADAGGEQWEVRVEVAVPAGARVHRLEVRTTWLGEQRVVALADGGQVPGDEPGDGTWTGRLVGPPLRFLPITLWVQTPGKGSRLARALGSLEPLSPGTQTLTYALDSVDPPAARRLSMGGTTSKVQRKEAWTVGLSLAWAVLMLLLVHWARHRCWRPWASFPDGAGTSLALWLVLSVAWTWPAAQSGPQLVAGRHFDVLGVLWFLEHASRFFQDRVDSYISYPLGIRYENFDSYTLVLLARAASWLDPARLHGWLQVLGLATTAWAAERFARALGARAPWTLLAGLTFAFSGLAASALVEGHVYFLLNPWMPLFGWAWWRATGEGGRWTHGFAAGLAFVAVLFTSAYLAVATAVLAVGFYASALARRRMGALAPGLGALAVVLPTSVFYLLVFLGNLGSTGTRASVEAVPLMSASLASLAAATPELDRTGHSLALCLSGVMLALVAAAPLLLPRRGRWRVLAWTAVAALLLSMGPVLMAGKQPSAVPLPFALLLQLPVGDFLRFPIRLAWGALLCGGVLAALAGTYLERRCGGACRVLVLLAIVEVFLISTRMPGRQAALPTLSPTAYLQVKGPVLDLLPQGLSSADDLNYWFWSTSCHYQTRHHRPLAEDCITTRVTENPRYVLGAWLTARLLSGEAARARRRLRQMGFAAVAFHPDLFHAGDSRRLEQGLASLDPAPVTTTDGGERLALYRLGAGGTSSRPAAVYGKLAPPEARSVGQGPAISRIASVRVELLGEERIPEVEYLVRFTGQGKGATELRLKNLVEPGSTALDIIWSGVWSEPLPGALNVRLVRRTPEGETRLWSGPVRFKVRHERLVFRLAPRAPDEQPTRAWPVAAVPVTPSPAADAHNGTVAAAGWGLYAALALGLGLWGWRRRRQEQTSNGN